MMPAVVRETRVYIVHEAGIKHRIDEQIEHNTSKKRPVFDIFFCKICLILSNFVKIASNFVKFYQI